MPPRTQKIIVFALFCFLFCSGLPICAQTSILGFTASAAAHEIEIESKFKAIPSPDEERRQHHILPPSHMSPAPNATMNWLAISRTNGVRKV